MKFRHVNLWFCCGLLSTFLLQTLCTHPVFYPISWKISCVTSDERIAPSSANQRIILNGLKGSSQQIDFDWETGRFQHYAIDIFYVSTNDIGFLKNVTLWNDNTRNGPIWVVSKITLENLDDGYIYETGGENIYVNRSKMITLVTNTFRPTTQELSTSFPTTLVLSSMDSSTENYLTEKETVVDTVTAEMTIQTTSDNSSENTTPAETASDITTDVATNSITNDATNNNWTDDTTQIISTAETINNSTNALVNITLTSTVSNVSSTSTGSGNITTTNSSNTTISFSTPAPMCLCPCRKKLTKEEQDEQLEEIKKELTIEKKKTSRYIRKKISVPDNRVSARATGYVGIVLLICPFALIIGADLNTLVAFLVVKYRMWKS